MTQAKKQAYIEGIETNRFKNDAQKIYNLIKEKPMDLIDLSYLLNKSFNRFSGRITDLLDAGLIKEIPCGRYSAFKASEPIERERLQRERLRAKIDKWVKCGEELGLEFSYQLKW
jgi:hypothetical protein